MRYWMALVFARDSLQVGVPTRLRLDQWVIALNCTKRNAQLVIKRLQQEGIIDWQAGVGRGHLPTVTLLYSVNDLIEREAERLLGINKVEMALSLIKPIQQDRFLRDYLSRHTNTQPRQLLQIPFYRATHGLDPIAISRRSEAHIASYLFAQLLKWDERLNGYRGDLALNWRPTSNGLALTLRKGAFFHDTSPLLAEDIVNHFRRLQSSNNDNARLFQLIDDIEVISPYRIHVYSTHAATILPKLLAMGAMGISKLKGSEVIGSGPFKLGEQNEWRTVLHRFDAYHGYTPWVDGVEIWNVGKEAKSLTTNADIVSTSLIERDQHSRFDHHRQWEMGAEYALLNSQQAHFRTQAQRMPLFQLIQSAGLPQSIIDEKVKVATSMSSVFEPECQTYTPSFQEATTQASAQHCAQDYPPLTILTYQLDQHIRYAQHLAESLSSRGIQVCVKVYEFPQFCLEETLKAADIIISGEVFGQDLELSYIDWMMTNSALLHSQQPRITQWMQTAVRKALTKSNELQRVDALRHIESQLIDKALYCPLFHVQQQISTSTSLDATDMLANGWIDFATVVVE
jgi:MarR-like DNA-binding transcriptional regulator SgrR of sgrS sRNA